MNDTCVSLLDDFEQILVDALLYLLPEFGTGFGRHELALRNVDIELCLLGQCQSLPLAVLHAILTLAFFSSCFLIEHRPGEFPHLGRYPRAKHPTFIVDGCIGHNGQDAHMSLSGLCRYGVHQAVASGKQRSVLRCSITASGSLTLGYRPRMESVIGQSSLAEIGTDVVALVP